MTNLGYVKLFRSVWEKGWASKPEYMAVWVHLLCRANFSEREVMIDGSISTMNPGQFVTSRKRLSAETGVHESKIQRILSCFENEHQIEQQTKSKYRVITISNWHQYQQAEHQNEQQMNSKRTADEQQMNTEKNVKKEKNVKNIKTSSFFLPGWVPPQEWNDYSEMRLAKDKKSWTPAAMKLNVKKLEKLVSEGYDAKEVLNQSVENGWKGLYPIKETITHPQQTRYPISKQGAAHMAMEEIERRFREQAEKERMDRAGSDGGLEEAGGAGFALLSPGGEPEDYT